MKLNRKDFFDIAVIACLVACFATFACVVVVFVLAAFGVCNLDQVVFHSWLLAFIQWLIVCVILQARDNEESQDRRFSRIESVLEEAGLTTNTNHSSVIFCKPLDTDKDEEKSESGGATTA